MWGLGQHVIGGKMCKMTHGLTNIGWCIVSALTIHIKEKVDPENYLLMHAMGPNVAGVIGSAIAAGLFLMFFA